MTAGEPPVVPIRPRAGWGGRRAGAGRPAKNGRPGVPHVRRPRLSSQNPVHVTWRVVRNVANLRGRRVFRVVRRSLAAARERLGARVVHFSVQSNHLHLVVEAAGKQALTRALRGLAVRLARGLNAALGRSGKVLADRYHARTLRTPLEVRRVLAYVLGNYHKHAAERGVVLGAGWMDGCSSAAWFDGWRVRGAAARAIGLARAGPLGEAPVARPHTWLLRVAWRRHGLLDPDAPRQSR